MKIVDATFPGPPFEERHNLLSCSSTSTAIDDLACSWKAVADFLKLWLEDRTANAPELRTALLEVCEAGQSLASN